MAGAGQDISNGGHAITNRRKRPSKKAKREPLEAPDAFLCLIAEIARARTGKRGGLFYVLALMCHGISASLKPRLCMSTVFASRVLHEADK